jgi:hypothetical protein
MSRLRKDLAVLDRAARAAERNPVVAPAEQATIGAAAQQIREAKAHLRAARSTLDKRQAAEKAWLALMTAGRAMLRCAGEPWEDPRHIPRRVEQLEKRRFRHARVASALRVYQRALHGQAFYVGMEEATGMSTLQEAFVHVENTIGQAREECRILSRGERR